MFCEKEFFEYLVKNTRYETASYFGIPISRVDRLRVKLNVPRKTFKYREYSNSLDNFQKEIIIGSLLGDGCLKSVGVHGRLNSAFVEIHGISQKDWLTWKLEKLNFLGGKLKVKKVSGRKINFENKVVNDETKSLLSCIWESDVHPNLTEMEKDWYRRDDVGEYLLDDKGWRIKKIPENILLTDTVFAVWYFDDGSNHQSNRTIVLNTQGFLWEECENLVEKLKIYGLNCGVCKNRNKPTIQIYSSSYLDAIAIAKTINYPSCLDYKTDLKKYVPPNYSTRFSSSN